jgi:hypothetical protein
MDLLYVAAALLWPMIFNRGVVDHGIREAEGYRIGRAVYWRLPTRAAAVVVLLAGLPILSVILFQGWIVTAVLLASSGITISLWLISPPGLKLVYREQVLDNGQRVFVLRRSSDMMRTLLTLVVLGLGPGLAVGTFLSQFLTQFLTR